MLGREGGSGGWSHLHFEIGSRQSSGKWGTEEGYAFLWQSYVAEFQPDVIAVARRYHLAAVGESVVLDGSRSWARSGGRLRFDWTMTDGSAAAGPRIERRYDRPGMYSEILKVTDAGGHAAWDFAVTPESSSPRRHFIVGRLERDESAPQKAGDENGQGEQKSRAGQPTLLVSR